jgi:hypothetical protein
MEKVTGRQVKTIKRSVYEFTILEVNGQAINLAYPAIYKYLVSPL